MAAKKLVQMAQKRVVVTGIGLLTPLGNSVESTWNSVCSGLTNMRCLTEQDNPGFAKLPKYIGATIGADFEKDYWMQLVPQTKNLYNAFAVSVVAEALAQSGWIPESPSDQLRTGLVLGSGLSFVTSSMIGANEIALKGFDAVKRQMILQSSTSIAIGEISQQFGLRGPVNQVSAACATGQVTIGDAFSAVQRGDADVMIAVSSENSVVPATVVGCSKFGLLVPEGSDPATASRPFDSKRNGFVISEGAAALILEELSHAQKRDATILAELRSYGCTCDGEDLIRPNSEGLGIYRSMQIALQRGGLSPEHIDHINAHGPSTEAGDLVEAKAIHRLFGSHKPVITSNKGSLGHMCGAAGTVEAAITALSVKKDVVPPILNLRDPLTLPDGSKLNFAMKLVRQPIHAALSLSFGVGGVNTSLLFTKYQEDSA